MGGREITLSGEVRIKDGVCSTTVDALDALKAVGMAYGVYSRAEGARDCRVKLLEGDHPALVVQEDISHHGSPQWKTVHTVTDDPRQIQRYMAFRDMMAMFREMEQEMERGPVLPPKAAQCRKGAGRGHER